MPCARNPAIATPRARARFISNERRCSGGLRTGRQMKIVTVVGARPQFIKAAAVSRTLRNMAGVRIDEHMVHTGQHFDDNMSREFFEELDMPSPRHHLGISR